MSKQVNRRRKVTRKATSNELQKRTEETRPLDSKPSKPPTSAKKILVSSKSTSVEISSEKLVPEDNSNETLVSKTNSNEKVVSEANSSDEETDEPDLPGSLNEKELRAKENRKLLRGKSLFVSINVFS